MKLVHADVFDYENDTVRSEQIKVNVPRQCHHCSETGSQRVVSLAISSVGSFGERPYILITACLLCGKLSVHYMHLMPQGAESFLERIISYPKLDQTTEFPKVIKENYTNFINIYRQAEKAECENLNELVGMGYRRALEFLVIDYLIFKKIDGVTEEWLTSPNNTLGQKITKIPSQRINDLAKASSYLGNDYTHYTRKHDKYGVEDLKAIIMVLVMEIESEIIYQKSLDIISKPKV